MFTHAPCPAVPPASTAIFQSSLNNQLFIHRPGFQQRSALRGAAGPAGSLMTVASRSCRAAVTDGLTGLDE